jgi:polysaccharide biosynthesis PFTS motif protein
MLGEASKAKATRLVNTDIFAVEYLFHYSRTIYRPMWTYEVERTGSKITAYFYSTFVMPKLVGGYEPQIFEWGPCNWPRFIVWDQYQEESMLNELGDTIEFIKAGPIYFSDSSIKIPCIPKNTVAIFDIPPHRPSIHLGISTLAEYFAAYPNVDELFLNDILTVSNELSGYVVFKTKRNIGNLGKQSYIKKIIKLDSNERVIKIDPSISATRLTNHCIAAISFPLTSSALYFSEKKIPSIYYDPVGWIQKDDLGARGLPIISGIKELRTWWRDVLEVSN